MATATAEYLAHARAMHPPEYWEDVQKCPAFKFNVDGSAVLNDRDPAYLNLLLKWRKRAAILKDTPTTTLRNAHVVVSNRLLTMLANNPRAVEALPWLLPLKEMPDDVCCSAAARWAPEILKAKQQFIAMPPEQQEAFKKSINVDSITLVVILDSKLTHLRF
jgi:hypothetical protein